MNTVTIIVLAFALVISLLAASPAAAWPGYEWDRWREISGEESPAISSAQSGDLELLPLLRESFDADSSIQDPAAWERKRDRIKKVLEELMGTPSNIERPTPAAMEVGREDMGTYERIHLNIASEADDVIPAFLLRPKSTGSKAAPGPVMIVLHQTQSPGKQEACGMTGDPSMAFAKELVERGITCIVPDAVGFGERIPAGGQPYDNIYAFFQRHPHWSCFGKMSWDIARVIDYLETLPEVDAERIGVIGHSHGAYGVIMGAVFEPRIKLVVASCGFTTLRKDPKPERWSHLTPLLPRLGFYVEDIETAPFDWHEVLACIAPRPCFNWATLNDDIFPNTDNLTWVYEQVTSVYSLYGAGDRFRGRLVPGPHRFPEEGRNAAYEWIIKQFRNEQR